MIMLKIIQYRWTHVFPKEECQDGSSQLSEEDEEDEHEELKKENRFKDRKTTWSILSLC